MARNIFGLVHTLLDNDGTLEVGGTIEVYDAGTTTPRTIYSDRGLTTTAGYQITADASGRLPERWIADGNSIKLVYKSASGSTLATRDYANDNDDAVTSNTVAYLATYAAMTALTSATGLSDNGIYYTYARATEEDGGAGLWRYDSASTTTADGGTILAIDGGGAGRFFRLDRITTILTGPLTSPADDENFGRSYRNSTLTSNAVYDSMYPAITHYDALHGVTEVSDTSDIHHATGVSGYISVDDSAVNGVALFGAGRATVNSAAVWGINTLVQDAVSRTAGTATGRRLTGELDYNVMNPDTQVIGLSVGGNSLAQSTNAVGYIVNVMGVGYKWTTGFFSQDGAATNGLALGALATSGTNVDSQNLILSYFNGAGVKKSLTIYAETNALVIGNNDTDLTVNINGYVQSASGKGFSVGTNLVVSNRVTGFTQMTGTATKTALATYGAGTASAGYVQAELQAVMNALQEVSRRLKAHEDAMFSHGLIGT